MTSFFPFASSSSSLSTPSSTFINDDTHLEVTVTPASSAFYAGETFAVTITFRNTRAPPPSSVLPLSSTIPYTGDVVSAIRPMPPAFDRHSVPHDLPGRRNQIGTGIKSSTGEGTGNAEAGSSRTPISAKSARPPEEIGYPYSPGADPAHRAPGWPGSVEDAMTIRSPEAWKRKDYGDIGRGPGHGRRTKSLALGKGVMSPQEMVWALGGQSNPPPLPSRRPPSATIPPNHPHSRKPSVTSNITSPPLDKPSLPLTSPQLLPIPEAPRTRPSELPLASRNTSSSRTTASSSATSSASASRSDVGLDGADSVTSSEITTPRTSSRRPLPSASRAHSRTPSYHNAYGASLLVNGMSAPPPPTHPYIRSQEPRGVTTILWAYTRLVAQFQPSNTYIPPDPLLPLRSMLLHQPVGSGSLQNPSTTPDADGGPAKSSTSRWQLSFGTGTIGNATQPSLTGSLFGLAKDLVYGGQGGSLEEERKRVWNKKDLPVLETSRSLIGVDVKLKEGESREFVYTIQLPSNLPPSFRGRAFRFTYDLVVSLTVALPGAGKRQKTKEISVPIRVWANVSLANPVRTYDVLKPIIQTKDEGVVSEKAHDTSSDTALARRRFSGAERVLQRGGDSTQSLQAYAKHLLDTVSTATPPLDGKPRSAPLSPSKVQPRNRILSPSTPVLDLAADERGTNGHLLDVPGTTPKSFGARKGSFVKGDDELVEEGSDEGGCGEAVEILSRHSPKSSYDIANNGEMVAVLTLTKTTFRLGESVLGIVIFNGPSERRVLKFSAYLESNEIIPESLLPLSPSSSGRVHQPSLHRLHAEFHSAYTIHTSRLAFSLDIPSDGTPAFSLAAGKEGFNGGLEWRMKLAFLVAVPPKRHARGSHILTAPGSVGDNDNKMYAAARTSSPLINKTGEGGKQEMECEIVECDIPVRVLAGNTAFVVKPSVHVV